MRNIYFAFILSCCIGTFVSAQDRDFHSDNDFAQSAEEIKKDSIEAIFYADLKKPHPREKMSKYIKYWSVNKGGKMVYTCFSKSRECITKGYDTYGRFRNPSARYKDASFKFEYRIIESKKSGSVHMLISMDSQGEEDQLWVGFSADGNLLCSRDPAVSDENWKLNWMPVKFISEPCKSIKPVGEVNCIEVLRKSKTWFIVVNKDTVKQLQDDKNYPIWDSKLGYEGPQIIEIDNVDTHLYVDSGESKKVLAEHNKIVAELESMNGKYKIDTIACVKGGLSTFYIDMKFSEAYPIGNFKCLITGLTDTPLTLEVYANSNKNFGLHTDPFKYYKIDGKDYSIEKMYFSKGVLYFSLSLILDHISGGTRSMYCNLLGTKQ